MTLKLILLKIKRDFPGVRISAAELFDHVWIFNLEVHHMARNMGVGSQVVAMLKEVGKPIALFPVSLDGRQKALERFYKRLGFKWEMNRKQLVWRNGV